LELPRKQGVLLRRTPQSLKWGDKRKNTRGGIAPPTHLGKEGPNYTPSRGWGDLTKDSKGRKGRKGYSALGGPLIETSRPRKVKPHDLV